jgi:phosphopantothenoylcysteine decarboxylase/phosphopantothenate--cysteine ligase
MGQGNNRHPRVLLVVGGGIAAYKSCELVRLIRKGGGEVTCVLTKAGAQFVTPMTLAALSENPVYTTLWDLKNETEMGHIQLSREADLVVVCPATADLTAKMASGIADDLATTLVLATDRPVLVVPAMNVKMWQNPATMRNVERLRAGGVDVMEPDEGIMACGDFGPGRLPEPEMIWLEIADRLGLDPGDAGAGEIEAFVSAAPPEDGLAEDDAPPALAEGGATLDEIIEEEPIEAVAPRGGGLGGLISSLISRSGTRRDEVEEIGYEEMEAAALGLDAPLPDAAQDWPSEPGDAGEPWPETPEGVTPDLGSPLLAKKGKAAAAPPTDPEAINHEMGMRVAAPQPLEGEQAGAFVSTGGGAGTPPSLTDAVQAVPDMDPLDGQPAFETDPAHRPLYGRHVLVTAGPTREKIDPVRYLANRSSGKQGFAIAAAAAAAGARVTLVSGPVQLQTPPGVDRIDVESALEMAAEVKAAMPADAAVMVAAVADWRLKQVADEKIKKRGSAPPALILEENPDILATLSASPERPPLLIGFAAETEKVIEHAKKKRKAKGADWIVANDVSGDVMGGDNNRVILVTRADIEHWDEASKIEVARQLVDRMAEHMNAETDEDDEA